ncbi:hypothetical protein [Nostoc sp. 'Peltigera malacea cyanobiont' DB3992]|nr:hypothetical protein [Nostoc sp. 'Peltigera malacea cyanobiont' DB3992]
MPKHHFPGLLRLRFFDENYSDRKDAINLIIVETAIHRVSCLR